MGGRFVPRSLVPRERAVCITDDRLEQVLDEDDGWFGGVRWETWEPLGVRAPLLDL